MAMNVQVMSVETVKPSSPTPHEKKTYKLSLLDQLNAPSYYSFVLFYSKPELSMSESALNDHLKTSLSKTLTHFYPFAGRVKDDYCVDCNDYGVSYVRTRIDVNMSRVLEHPDIDVIGQLVPSCPSQKSIDVREKPFLVFQVNVFACGGVALGVNFLHRLADASSVGSFLRSWATVARGDTSYSVEEGGALVVDCASLFPRRGDTRVMQDILTNAEKDFATVKTKTTIKWLAFEGPKITALKEKIGKGRPSFMERPISRVVALYALIWGAIIRIAKEEKEQSNSNCEVHYHSAICMVNLRKRFDPPLPAECMGNLSLGCIAQWLLDDTIDYNLLAGKISQSIKTIDNDFLINTQHQLSDYFSKLMDLGPDKLFRFNSLCNFPFRESDFGFGKPIWSTSGTRDENFLLLFDSRDGEGIEGWLALPEEYIVKFKRDPAILEYAKFHC